MKSLIFAVVGTPALIAIASAESTIVGKPEKMEIKEILPIPQKTSEEPEDLYPPKSEFNGWR